MPQIAGWLYLPSSSDVGRAGGEIRPTCYQLIDEIERGLLGRIKATRKEEPCLLPRPISPSKPTLPPLPFPRKLQLNDEKAGVRTSGFMWITAQRGLALEN